MKAVDSNERKKTSPVEGGEGVASHGVSSSKDVAGGLIFVWEHFRVLSRFGTFSLATAIFVLFLLKFSHPSTRPTVD